MLIVIYHFKGAKYMSSLKQKLNISFVWRVLIYLVGLFCISLGVSISKNAALGISPVNSLPFVVGGITGMQASTWIIILFSFYVVLQIVILGKDFKWINLCQIIYAVIFGKFVDFTGLLIGDFAIPTYFGQLAMVAVSIVLIALGVSLYVSVKILPMPSEGLALAVATKSGKISFSQMKIVVDCVFVALGIILSLLLYKGDECTVISLGSLELRLAYIREGTVITALLVGKIVGLWMKVISKPVNRICFPEK